MLASATNGSRATLAGAARSGFCSSMFAEMERDHQQLNDLAVQLTATARELSAAAADERSEGARRFYRLFASFVGRYLGHMAQEEGP